MNKYMLLNTLNINNAYIVLSGGNTDTLGITLQQEIFKKTGIFLEPGTHFDFLIDEYGFLQILFNEDYLSFMNISEIDELFDKLGLSDLSINDTYEIYDHLVNTFVFNGEHITTRTDCNHDELEFKINIDVNRGIDLFGKQIKSDSLIKPFTIDYYR